MPDGSSSAAPVTNPGPSNRSNKSLGFLSVESRAVLGFDWAVSVINQSFESDKSIRQTIKQNSHSYAVLKTSMHLFQARCYGPFGLTALNSIASVNNAVCGREFPRDSSG